MVDSLLEDKALETIFSLEEIKPGIPSVVTIGVFDGVHVGHQAIMRIVRADSVELGARSVAVTFNRNPVEVVRSGRKIRYITTLRQKLQLIAEQGMDITLVLPVERWLLDMLAKDFVSRILCNKLSTIQVVVGRNFTFGRDRTGNADLLRQMGAKLGFEVVAVSPIRLDDVLVSSTAIRNLLSGGKVEKANVLLGHPFVLEGKVVPGKGVGRSLGFPTANIEPAANQVVPARGVYAVSVNVGNNTYNGVLNIGRCPTISNKGHRESIEVHLIGFAGDLYGQSLEVAFHHRLRDEECFPEVESLKRQIIQDIEIAGRLVEYDKPEPI